MGTADQSVCNGMLICDWKENELDSEQMIRVQHGRRCVLPSAFPFHGGNFHHSQGIQKKKQLLVFFHQNGLEKTHNLKLSSVIFPTLKKEM